MKELIIVGAGGMGRTIYDMVLENSGYMKDFTVKGFIDDKLEALTGFASYPPIIGSISGYKVEMNDVFVCSIGGESRKKSMQSIIERGGDFISLIHPTARIGTNVKLGKGCYVGAFTTIAADAKIGDYNFIQSNCIIGHDVVIGCWNRIDSYVMFVGGTKVGEECTIHTKAMISHNVAIGNNAHIGACSLVISNVGDNCTFFGVPAKRIK